MRVGILGGGQLARMLALAGHPLGLDFVVLDPAKDACGGTVARHLPAAFDDKTALQEFTRQADIATYEFENPPPASVREIAVKIPVFPSPEALAISRDRLAEKTMFNNLGLGTAAFAAVNSRNELEHAVDKIGLPAVLKTRTLGYDGKGQTVLKQRDQTTEAWTRLGGVPCILESFVAFNREISIIGVRSRTGDTAFYPVSENTHRDGILRLSICRPGDPMQHTAVTYAAQLLEHLDYVGVLALELFDTGNTLLANEIAPRVHNTGHWTIDGAVCSQFENHLRAVLGLPLGDTAANGISAMVNFIGHVPPLQDVLALKHAHFHNYGKAPKPGRKLGHATLCGASHAMIEAELDRLMDMAYRGN